jgi:hypothetical protein
MRSHVYLSLDEIRPAIEINATWEGSRRTTTCEPGKRRARGKVPGVVSRKGRPSRDREN